jgi:hypothetical protein
LINANVPEWNGEQKDWNVNYHKVRSIIIFLLPPIKSSRDATIDPFEQLGVANSFIGGLGLRGFGTLAFFWKRSFKNVECYDGASGL